MDQSSTGREKLPIAAQRVHLISFEEFERAGHQRRKAESFTLDTKISI
jgi:hypothetical protein